ncbi:unnamed protein product [Cuscuta epithymum]|uniref:Uncharacterized protein n=1 Tax=Cuscuta epithymum TaxID=186058 RepID=A0AAV0DTU7_9ASTE|nr:unnamed protein product [Cuscuta epithymum]
MNQPCRPRRLLKSKKKKDKKKVELEIAVGSICALAVVICAILLLIRSYLRHKDGKDICWGD